MPVERKIGEGIKPGTRESEGGGGGGDFLSFRPFQVSDFPSYLYSPPKSSIVTQPSSIEETIFKFTIIFFLVPPKFRVGIVFNLSEVPRDIENNAHADSGELGVLFVLLCSLKTKWLPALFCANFIHFQETKQLLPLLGWPAVHLRQENSMF